MSDINIVPVTYIMFTVATHTKFFIKLLIRLFFLILIKSNEPQSNKKVIKIIAHCICDNRIKINK